MNQFSQPMMRPYVMPPAPRKKKRVFLWVFLAVQALFIVWLVAGIAGASGTPTDCGTLDAATCNDAESVGTGIAVAMIVGVWMAVDFLLGVGYGVYRLATRP